MATREVTCESGATDPGREECVQLPVPPRTARRPEGVCRRRGPQSLHLFGNGAELGLSSNVHRATMLPGATHRTELRRADGFLRADPQALLGSLLREP